ncbi:uncharacterized protein BX663DRAFT_485007 [Cokeromyces recurvatus]|uniref:uncharacterized protein n=1 Tax=Cokeromyces recurvatus TaxID=90255 RepID=UPI00221ED752|nr:uncharacterized protein BX663DRAFT_485007 [Cokeromyces recurvatus]KAI7904159.1 hypothetical protein BX663DRAFT_485007 [Cokeromyces recurvatus]
MSLLQSNFKITLLGSDYTIWLLTGDNVNDNALCNRPRHSKEKKRIAVLALLETNKLQSPQEILSAKVLLNVSSLLISELDKFSFAFVNKRHWKILFLINNRYAYACSATEKINGDKQLINIVEIVAPEPVRTQVERAKKKCDIILAKETREIPFQIVLEIGVFESSDLKACTLFYISLHIKNAMSIFICPLEEVDTCQIK